MKCSILNLKKSKSHLKQIQITTDIKVLEKPLSSFKMITVLHTEVINDFITATYALFSHGTF